MNKTYRKLKKLQAMAVMVSNEDKNLAESKSKDEYDYRQYLTIDVEWVEEGSMPEVCIYRGLVNCDGYFRSATSWTDIPYDKLFEAWTYVEDMKDSYHEEFAAVTSLLRSAMKHGLSNLKFGTYKRTVKSVDYLDFKVK